MVKHTSEISIKITDSTRNNKDYSLYRDLDKILSWSQCQSCLCQSWQHFLYSYFVLLLQTIEIFNKNHQWHYFIIIIIICILCISIGNIITIISWREGDPFQTKPLDVNLFVILFESNFVNNILIILCMCGRVEGTREDLVWFRKLSRKLAAAIINIDPYIRSKIYRDCVYVHKYPSATVSSSSSSSSSHPQSSTPSPPPPSITTGSVHRVRSLAIHPAIHSR